MSDQKPYDRPSADFESPSEPSEPAIAEPRTVAADRGAGWIFEGFAYFKANPLGWIAALLVLFVISALLSLIPLGSIVFNVISPVFTAGIMLGCHSHSQGGSFRFSHLFAGFSSVSVKQLLLIGLILLGLSIVVAAVLGGIAMVTIDNLFDLSPEQLSEHVVTHPQYLLLFLLMLVFFVPLAMALWFAPALAVLNHFGALEAMLSSFNGCLKNIPAFLVFGIVALVILILSTIPFALGLLVTLPMLMASTYIAYREIFT